MQVKTAYECVVTTSDMSGAGTNANVFIALYGADGKSDPVFLRNKTDNFERGQVYQSISMFHVCVTVLDSSVTVRRTSSSLKSRLWASSSKSAWATTTRFD